MWWLASLVFAYVVGAAVIIEIQDLVAYMKYRKRKKKLHYEPKFGCWGRSWK